jgi:SAM-dependent methyltransferase
MIKDLFYNDMIQPMSRRIPKIKFLDPCWLLRGIEYKVLYAAFPQFMRGKLLDVGCSDKPHAEALSPYITEHIGLDHEGMFHDKSKVDIFADAYNTTCADGEYDSILCTNVLEHLEDPQRALKEFARILKKNSSGGGGINYCSFFMTFT